MKYVCFLISLSVLSSISHKSAAQISWGLNAETQTVVLHKKEHFTNFGSSTSIGGIIKSTNEKQVSYEASLLLTFWAGSWVQEPAIYLDDVDLVNNPDRTQNFNIVELKIPFGFYKYTEKNHIIGGGAYMSTWIFNKVYGPNYSINNAKSISRFDYGLSFQFGWQLNRFEFLLMAEYSFRNRFLMSSGSNKIHKYSTGFNVRYLF